MINSVNDKCKCPKSQAISLLLANDPKILRFLFRPGVESLWAPAEDLLWESGVLSSSEQILVRLALDIWSDEGGARLWDAVSRLDAVRFESFLLAMECLRYGHPKH